MFTELSMTPRIMAPSKAMPLKFRKHLYLNFVGRDQLFTRQGRCLEASNFVLHLACYGNLPRFRWERGLGSYT